VFECSLAEIGCAKGVALQIAQFTTARRGEAAVKPVPGTKVCAASPEWHAPGLRSGMTGISIEHAQIIEWTQNRGGHPVIKRPSAEAALPVIDFSNEDGEVSWDEWLNVFDHGEWAFIYQDRTPEGELSLSCKIIPRFEPDSEWTCEIRTRNAPQAAAAQ
jgi:hypothetical protein